ncbi:MAG: hypothetical protein OHK0029_35800 [Armatimonadaceae bacterium]
MAAENAYGRVSVKEWDSLHPRWEELQAAIDAAGQTRWVEFTAAWHRSSHLLVGLRDGTIVGFLRFVVQDIGAEDNATHLMPPDACGAARTEAKILAFGVPEHWRRQGIGRALQIAAIDRARNLNCWQIRSFSDSPYDANHHLKLSLGYAAQVLNTERRKGIYFVLPLRYGTDQ